jgi:type IV pilus assembly protein PilC
MAKYQYRAVNLGGRAVEGIFEGQDRGAVVSMLRSKSFYPLEITEIKTSGGLNRELGTKISLKVLSLFCQQFSTILSSGIAVGQALDILAQQTEDKRLKAVLKDVYEKVQTGRSLTDAFGEHAQRFPSIFISMISVGEVSGTMEASLKRLHGYFKQEYSLVSKFRTAMIYPAVVLSLAVVITTFLLVFIVPTFQGIFASYDAVLPLPTRILLGLSGFIRTQYPAILIAIVAAVLLYRAYSKSPDGRLALDRMKLKTPVFGQLNVKLMVSRFTRTLGAMSSSGVPLTQSLDITARVVANKFIEKQIVKASEAVQQGQPLYKQLAEIKSMPVMVQNMTRLGEESGSLDYMLEQTAVFYDMETETSISKTVAFLEPMVIIVMACIILFVVLSILLPTFRMATVVSSGISGN